MLGVRPPPPWEEPEVRIHLPPAESPSLSWSCCRRSRTPAFRAAVRGWRVRGITRRSSKRQYSRPPDFPRRAISSQEPGFQLTHPAVTLQGEDLGDLGDAALHPCDAAFGQDTRESRAHRSDGRADGVVATNDQPYLTQCRHFRERELRVGGRY